GSPPVASCGRGHHESRSVVRDVVAGRVTMQKNRKPEDCRESAEDSLELAKVLAGQGKGASATRLFWNEWPAATTSWTMTAKRAACATTSFSVPKSPVT